MLILLPTFSQAFSQYEKRPFSEIRGDFIFEHVSHKPINPIHLKIHRKISTKSITNARNAYLRLVETLTHSCRRADHKTFRKTKFLLLGNAPNASEANRICGQSNMHPLEIHDKTDLEDYIIFTKFHNITEAHANVHLGELSTPTFGATGKPFRPTMPLLNLKTKSPVNNETLTETIFIKTNNSIKINYIYTYLTHHHHDLTVNDYFDLTNIEQPELTLRNKPFLDNLTLITNRNWTKISWSRLQNGEWSYKTTPPNESYQNVTTIQSTVTFNGIQRPDTAVVCSMHKDDNFTLTEHFSDTNLKCRSAAVIMWNTLNVIDTKLNTILPTAAAADFTSSSTAETFLPPTHGMRTRRNAKHLQLGTLSTLLEIIMNGGSSHISDHYKILLEALRNVRKNATQVEKAAISNTLKFIEEAPLDEWIKTAQDAFQSGSLTWADLQPLRTLDYLFLTYFDDFKNNYNSLTTATGDFINNHNLQHYITNVELHGLTLQNRITQTLNEIITAQNLPRKFNHANKFFSHDIYNGIIKRSKSMYNVDLNPDISTVQFMIVINHDIIEAIYDTIVMTDYSDIELIRATPFPTTTLWKPDGGQKYLAILNHPDQKRHATLTHDNFAECTTGLNDCIISSPFINTTTTSPCAPWQFFTYHPDNNITHVDTALTGKCQYIKIHKSQMPFFYTAIDRIYHAHSDPLTLRLDCIPAMKNQTHKSHAHISKRGTFSITQGCHAMTPPPNSVMILPPPNQWNHTTMTTSATDDAQFHLGNYSDTADMYHSSNLAGPKVLFPDFHPETDHIEMIFEIILHPILWSIIVAFILVILFASNVLAVKEDRKTQALIKAHQESAPLNHGLHQPG